MRNPLDRRQVASLVARVQMRKRGFMENNTAAENKGDHLEGKVVLITGAISGPSHLISIEGEVYYTHV